jgi:hypothetical protein
MNIFRNVSFIYGLKLSAPIASKMQNANAHKILTFNAKFINYLFFAFQ